jgi:hypothetical protein
VKKSVAVPKQKLDNEGRIVDYTKTYIIQVESKWISGTQLRYVKEPEDVTGDVIFTVEVEKHKTFTGDPSVSHCPLPAARVVAAGTAVHC